MIISHPTRHVTHTATVVTEWPLENLSNAPRPPGADRQGVESPFGTRGQPAQPLYACLATCCDASRSAHLALGLNRGACSIRNFAAVAHRGAEDTLTHASIDSEISSLTLARAGGEPAQRPTHQSFDRSSVLLHRHCVDPAQRHVAPTLVPTASEPAPHERFHLSWMNAQLAPKPN